MDKKRWQEISNVLDKVLAIDESEQLTYLQAHYGDDEELVQEVRELLFSISESEKTRFLASARDDSKSLLKDIELPEQVESSSESLIGQDVGPYKIAELLARGGMGSVYKAERIDGQFDQTVAIKFINRQNFGELAYSRFRREQKILANLNHPNIAMLLDGGVTQNGFPYLIMEYVEGTRIDHYCSENRLGIDQRIELIKKILNAISYAHSNLVIHRDLKPGNILVTQSGEVKILDFGIAALINDDEENADEPLTKTGQRLWTPQYAAPEQVLEKPPQLQTDIYSLGGLICKLLSGTPPFDFKNRSIHEVEKTILEENPPLMSRAAGRLDDDTVWKQFGIKKKALVKELTNDLDAIAARCLRKEPEYRYASVSLLLDDIIRYQNNEPVTAQKGNVAYRARKYLKRNSQPILTAAVLFLAITATVAYYTMQVNNERIHAEREAAKSQQMTEFLVGIFESANAHIQDGTALGLDASIGSILDVSISKMDEELAGQPLVNASLKTTLGKMYLRLGEFERAEKLTTDAVESLSILDTDTRTELAQALYELGRVHQETGNTQMADSLLLQAIEIHKSTEQGLIDEQALAAVSMYANLQWFNHGDFETADSLLSGNLEIRYRHFPDKPGNLAVGHNDLAAMNHSRGSIRKASVHYREAVNLYRSAFGDHPATAVAMGNYSILLREYNRLDEAEEIQREALRIHVETTGEETIDTGLGNGNLGNIMYLKGDLDKADSLTARSIEILTNIYGDVHPFVGRSKLLKAGILAERELYSEAEELYKMLIDHYSRFYPPDHARQADPLLGLGDLYLAMEEPELAEPFLSEAYQIRKAGYSENNWRTAVAMNSYAEALISLNRHAEADELLLNSISILKSEFGENDFRVLNAQQLLINI